MKKIILLITIMTAFGTVLTAAGFGSAGSFENDNPDLEEMLRYAMEDEQTALAEYEAIMEKFDVTRPYSNIAKSEETHITYLEELYDSYEIEVPFIDAGSHLVIPATLEEAARIGVEAEIANIAMYDKFLAGDLPEDVREVFTDLQAGSENHLRAFERQVEKSSGSGRGRNRN